MQFLCENGRVQKFANSFCSPAFMFQEYAQQSKDLFGWHSNQISVIDLSNENPMKTYTAEHFVPLPTSAYSQLWNEYIGKLVGILCSFLFTPEDTRSHNVEVSSGQAAIPVSSVYGELSIKWVMRVLLTVFPCVKACSDQNELPNHIRLSLRIFNYNSSCMLVVKFVLLAVLLLFLFGFNVLRNSCFLCIFCLFVFYYRVFLNTLQRYVLNTFRKVLVSSPVLLEVLREEGIWNLIFSENFFYFGPSSEEFSGEYYTYHDGSPRKPEIYATSSSTDSQVKSVGVETLQMEIISFLEFAATSNGSAHNLVGAPFSLNPCIK